MTRTHQALLALLTLLLGATTAAARRPAGAAKAYGPPIVRRADKAPRLETPTDGRNVKAYGPPIVRQLAKPDHRKVKAHSPRIRRRAAPDFRHVKADGSLRLLRHPAKFPRHVLPVRADHRHAKAHGNKRRGKRNSRLGRIAGGL